MALETRKPIRPPPWPGIDADSIDDDTLELIVLEMLVYKSEESVTLGEIARLMKMEPYSFSDVGAIEDALMRLVDTELADFRDILMCCAPARFFVARLTARDAILERLGRSPNHDELVTTPFMNK
ncbi:hypothetical protein EF808_05505 [archaeon]|jgi:hypothetical protein|nr:MAG: hypothetical protein EF808_05505 [archaeon]